MEARAGDSGGRFAVVATLIAAAIGGIFGLTGSVVGYLQAERSLEHSDKQHLEDVRREAYGNLIDSWSDVRLKYHAFGDRAVAGGGTPIPSHFDKIRDAYRSLEAKNVRVYLVAPPNVSTSAYEVDTVFAKWRDQLLKPPNNNYTTDMRDSLNRELSDKIIDFKNEARKGLTQ
jgi:hypothetical protein